MTSAMCLLRVLLLGALLCPGKGLTTKKRYPPKDRVPSTPSPQNLIKEKHQRGKTQSAQYQGNGDQEEIFTRPGSDLLLPIRIHLTLSHTNTLMCDRYDWKYKNPPRTREDRLFLHRSCNLTKYEHRLFSNMRISENGSLIISNVTLENDGRYSVEIQNSAGDIIQEDYYRVHVEVPVSVPVLGVSCLRNGSAEISCRVEAGTKPNISLSVIGGSQENYSTSTNNIRAIVGSPGPWNITCTVKNWVSMSENRTGVTCPVPLSNIAVNSSCLLDGSAVAVCSVKGSDPHYSWSLNGRSVSSHSQETLPPPVSGTLHCDVTNQINKISKSINIFCPVPVSDPVLDVKCLQNGSAEISCEVKNGTDPSIYLTVSGELMVDNVTRSERTVRVTISPPDTWNISCLAKNNISERSTNQTRGSCPVPVSDPVLDVKCLQNGSAEISCEVKNGTDPSIYLTVKGKLMVDNVTRSERTVRVTVPHVSPAVSWNISCLAKNNISERSTNQTRDACPEIRWSPLRHLLSHGVVCVLYTALLIFIVTDLRKMKNEKNRSERRTRRRDQTEMEMEPTYCN